jgi:tetratricopeptide (TPR) repeat protein
MIFASIGMGLLHRRQGRFQAAIPILEEGLALCENKTVPFLLPIVASELGVAYALAGRLEEAIRLCELGVSYGASMGLMFGEALRLTSLSETFWMSRRRQEAVEAAERALRASREHRTRGHEAWVLRLLGEIAAHGDSPDTESAEDHYRKALELADAHGMRPLVAHCHLGLGTLYRRAGKPHEGQGHLGRAAEMYRDMAMPSCLEQAQAAWRGAQTI